MWNSKMLLRLVCAAVVVLMFVKYILTNSSLVNDVDETNTSPDRSDKENAVSSEPADGINFGAAWERLSFEFPNETEIIGLEFVIDEDLPNVNGAFPRLDDSVEAVLIKLSDANMLREARFCFDEERCLRHVIRPGVKGGAGNAYLIGTLRFKTTSGEFQIGIGNTGFSIDGKAPGVETEFFAPAGAEFIDFLYHQHTKRPLPENLLHSLSGMTFVLNARDLGKQKELQ